MAGLEFLKGSCVSNMFTSRLPDVFALDPSIRSPQTVQSRSTRVSTMVRRQKSLVQLVKTAKLTAMFFEIEMS